MAQDCPTKTRVQNLPSDIISNLPMDVLETILTFLSFRDAVRTSVLSKKWRYSWVHIPKLVFDDSLFPESEFDQCNPYMTIINHVLLLHRGPIQTFTLNFTFLEVSPELDQLIHFLSNSRVQEFTLCIGDEYKLPSDFYSFSQLTRLDLGNCVFEPPLGFHGFSRLINLNFDEVEIDGDAFVNLISNCPLIESITFKGLLYYPDLELVIDAPMLKTFRFDTDFSSIRFKNTPLLEFVSVTVFDVIFPKKSQSNVIEVFSSLPAIKEFQSGNYFTRFLFSGGVPEKLPFTINQLRSLQFNDFCFKEIGEVSLVLCLIKSSPNLKILNILAGVPQGCDGKDAVELIKVNQNSNAALNRLRRVYICMVCGLKAELEFIRLILAKSPELEELCFQFHSMDSCHEKMRIFDQVNGFKRASPDARISLRLIR